jgi:hypothetical protein
VENDGHTAEDADGEETRCRSCHHIVGVQWHKSRTEMDQVAKIGRIDSYQNGTEHIVPNGPKGTTNGSNAQFLRTIRDHKVTTMA